MTRGHLPPEEPPGGDSAQRFHSPGASPLRRALEQRSTPALLALRRAPRWVLPVVAVGLLLAGLAIPAGWAGGAALLVLALLLGWLAYLSWPSAGVPGRVLRGAALATLLALAALRLLGRY